MRPENSGLDSFAIKFAEFIIRFRWLVLMVGILGAIAIASNASKLEFSSNYRIFFSEENPELRAFEEMQLTYTKSDNFLFVVEPRDGKVFTPGTLKAVQELTEGGWRAPFAIRVDSITNFQRTYAIEDELIVEDLVGNDPDSYTPAQLFERQEIALAEPLLVNQILKDDASVTAVNVTLQYLDQSLTEVPEAVAFARGLRDEIQAKYPEVRVYLTGTSMLNNAFTEAANNDASTLVPAMLVIVLLLTMVSLRSFSAMFAVLVVIILSVIVALGAAGIVGIRLSPPAMTAPVIILTLAVADSIHILMTMRTSMRNGMPKRDAIIEAVRINFLAVAITSLTTSIGFLALNFSDSPPFRDLGNISALGIAAAWIFSITVLIALISIVPFRPKAKESAGQESSMMIRFANLVVGHSGKWFLLTGVGVLALVSFIPTLQLDDQFREYFDRRMEFRRDTDDLIQHFGFYPVEFSVPAGEAGGISEPEFLRKLDDFTEFLRAHESVTHVYSFTDIIKRLNKNMNRDDPAYYRIPEDRELAAQYLLLYELSLPYGLDLNDRINIDKSATRISITLSGETSSARTKELLLEVKQWFDENAPSMQATPTGPQVMFTFIADRNVRSMISGTIIAIIAIAIILMITLRSFGMGLLSLVPNAMPILAAFGAWALLVGFVGFSVAAVAVISLGIVVDDTVHFLIKFVRARREKELTIQDSIRYAFDTVGIALVVNTIILAIGFSVLTASSFKINAEMGLLTTLSIIFALILDFLFLPFLLMLGDRGNKQQSTS